jgi:hypothetical protein
VYRLVGQLKQGSGIVILAIRSQLDDHVTSIARKPKLWTSGLEFNAQDGVGRISRPKSTLKIMQHLP